MEELKADNVQLRKDFNKDETKIVTFGNCKERWKRKGEMEKSFKTCLSQTRNSTSTSLAL